MHRECKINIHEDNELVTIEVLGDLTASAEKAVDDAYQKACGYTPRNILLKFDGKSRINSAGIATIINMVTESQGKDCDIFVTGLSKHFQKIFELVGLTKYTTLVDSEEEVRRL